MTRPVLPTGPLRVQICDDDRVRSAPAEAVGAQPGLTRAGSAADAATTVGPAPSQ
nr:hypothetical protein OG409_35620 [Streptomyces sp. NBC_00974]